ncbi:MAG: FHA domain-containing protein [Pyrinomonadaceae bacterium]|nr:FHA domain-containing protein [Pyrinomonadaceae bacterium]
MKKVTFYINSDGERQEVRLDNELSVGRTGQASLALPDSGLSRVNSTFFRDGESVFVVDENSTNGTFVNGEQVFGSPRKLQDGDRITVGSNTQISVEIIDDKPVSATPTIRPEPTKPPTKTKSKTAKKGKGAPTEKQIPLIPVIAGIATVFIIFFAVVALLIAGIFNGNSNKNATPTASMSSEIIPKRVIDPLGGEDPDDVDDLIAAWEAEDVPTDAKDLEAVKSTSTDAESKELNVSVEFWQQMKDLAMQARSAPTGERPPGLAPTNQLCCGVPKQTAKLEQMVRDGYTQPLDFADLADKRMHGDLIELPLATKYYFVDVGGNANDSEFTQFNWATRSTPLPKDSAEYQTLQKLASNFSGQKYDLNNPNDRKQMKKRLLRMFNKRAKPILEELAMAYQQKFGRPLRVTSLTRSMEYQISLNANNANSFKVSGEGSRPPHTSGCAFDLARKHMTTEEQNFMINKLSEMEDQGKLDALIEYHANSCFHIFIYPDGLPPGVKSASSVKSATPTPTKSATPAKVKK